MESLQKVLVIEDVEADFLTLERRLHRDGVPVQCRRIDGAGALEAALEEAWDVVLVDYTVPGMDFRATLERIRSSVPDLPVILVSGTVDETLALDLLHLGLTDFILKGELARLPTAVRRAREERESRDARRRAEAQLQRYVSLLEQAVQGTIDVVMTMSEIRDPYTHGHERRVGELSAAIAGELALGERRVEGVRTCGFLHDVGKISVPAEILAKPGKLSDAELQLVKDHAQRSHAILKQADLPRPVAEAAWQHHERMDGSGYPRGLAGDAIILEARILSVADVVEAMASHRPYRAARGIDAALAEIERGAGTLYDPRAVRACLALFRDKGYEISA